MIKKLNYQKLFIVDSPKNTKMDIIDKHFLQLPKKRQVFFFVIVIGYFLVGLIAYTSNLINLAASFSIMLVGILFGEIIKLSYRIELLEKKKKK